MQHAIYVIHRGVRDSLRGHARRLGVGYGMVKYRARTFGTSDPEALFAPARPREVPPFRDPSGHLGTLEEHAARLHISIMAFRARYRKFASGRLTLDGLFDPVCKRRGDTSWEKRITHDGITDTFKGWAKRLGLRYRTLFTRYLRYRGKPDADERIFCPFRRRAANVLVTYKGRTHTIAEWSRIRGMRGCTIHNRLRKGATPAQALYMSNWRTGKAVVQPAHGNHTRRKLAALGIFA